MLGAWTPRPFGYTTPPMVIGLPSPAGRSPLLRSFSTGPHALIVRSQVRSLAYGVPAPGAAGGTTAGTVNGTVTRPPFATGW